jgi:hypothetical protein
MAFKRISNPGTVFGILVIAISAITIATVGHMLWYGLAVFAALAFAYFIAISTPELSSCAPKDPPAKLKYILFLCAFIAAILAVFIGHHYPSMPWPEDARSLSTTQVESLLRAHRTLLFGVCTLFSVAYLHVVLLILRYLRQQRKSEGVPVSSSI